MIVITGITLDGREASLEGLGYTTSDDGKCTRVNLYNAWVSQIPAEARSVMGLTGASPTILDPTDCVGIKNITVNFKLITK